MKRSIFLPVNKTHLVIASCLMMVLLVCSCGNNNSSVDGAIAVRWTRDAEKHDRATAEVYGLSPATLKRLQDANMQLPQWRNLFPVYAGEASAGQSLPPMLGTYSIESNLLRFEPQFPLERGIAYQAIFRPGELPDSKAAGGAAIEAVLTLPRDEASATMAVSQVYPSADLLPENLLKFYIHFTSPMSRGRIYDHIHLIGENGKEIELPFLEIDEELWDPTMTRLTLFIDPGRIKRGVRPLEEVGPSLEAGKSYTLVIDRDWKDGKGNLLGESFKKTFKVAAPDRTPPDHNKWRIEPPAAGTIEPLAVDFGEPMDHALASRVISVRNTRGETLGGKVVLQDRERRWIFSPDSSWQGGRYELAIQNTLEDLAGNNIGKPFEVDLFEGVTRRQAISTFKLHFDVR